jgi:hypothetical protein
VKRPLLALLLSLPLAAATQPDATVFPQIVDGGGWRSELTFVNIEPNVVSFRVYFLAPNGRELVLPLERLGPASFVDVVLLSGQTETLATTGTAERVTQGWAVVRKAYETDVLGGTAVLRYRSPDGFEEEAAYELQPAARRLLSHFENTADIATSVAVANTSAYSMGLRAIIRDSNGVPVGDETLLLAPFERRTFALPEAFRSTQLRKGTIEWIAETASLAMISFRFSTNGIRAVPSYQHPNW